MAEVGKCLLFYLKYPAEMERLYAAEEPDLTGLPDADRVLEKIRLVGDTANREVVELLETCAPVIESHFQTMSSLERVRSNLEVTWSLKYRVAAKPASGPGFQLGVWLHDRRHALIPWVWCVGGRRAEDEVVRILGRGSRAGSGQLVSDPGTVALAEIPITLPARPKDFSLAREPLIAQVQQAFATFRAEDVTAIAALAGDRREA